MEDEAIVLNRAQRAFNEKDWRAAGVAYGQLVASPRFGAEGYYGLGIVKLAEGCPEEARSFFARAVERDGGHSNALYYLAALSSTPAEAERFYTAALAANPQHAGAKKKLDELRAASVTGARSLPTGLGVFEFLKQDPTALSQQSVKLIESLRMDRGLRTIAFVDEAIAITLGAVAALAIVALATFGLGAMNAGHTIVPAPQPASPLPLVSAQLATPLPLSSNVRIVRPGRLVGPGLPSPGTNRGISYVLYAGVAIVALWLLSLAVLLLKIRGVRVRFDDGRIYCTRGVLRKDLTTTDLWLVSNITLNRSIWNRMTGDGELRLYGSGGATLQRLKGLAREPELGDIYQRLQDLKFALRANPVVKGIIQ